MIIAAIEETVKTSWATYAGAWAPITAAERDALLRKAVSESVTFSSLSGEGQGIAALAEHIAGFQKLFPGDSFKTRSNYIHHNQLLASWTQCNADGTEVLNGHTHVRFNEEGKILSLSGFWPQ